MVIHPLRTGSARVKRSFLYPRSGVRRQLDLFLPGPWADPIPILCWAVEHEGRVLLVDTGETATARKVPFARPELTPRQELPSALAAAGIDAQAISEVVLTHHHGDHVDGLVHVQAPASISQAELDFIAQPSSRLLRRVMRQPLPAGFAPTPLTLGDGPFGAFASSRRLSPDGRIVAVPTPGHTPGHISVICVDDNERHVMLAGDATYTLEQLHARRPDAVGPDPRVNRATHELILEHCRRHPTVFLPSHDPDSAARLESGETVVA